MTRRFGFVVLSAAVLGGCSSGWLESTSLPFFHRIDVQQGNVVTQDMLARLEHGMDRAKVRSIMGTSLVKDVFNQDRWDYVYTMKPAGEDRVERRVTLYFQEERLVRVAQIPQGQGGIGEGRWPRILGLEERVGAMVLGIVEGHRVLQVRSR